MHTQYATYREVRRYYRYEHGIPVLLLRKGNRPRWFRSRSLIYLTNFGGDESKQQTQQLFCHKTCLRASLHPTTPLYRPGRIEDGPPTSPPPSGSEGKCTWDGQFPEMPHNVHLPKTTG